MKRGRETEVEMVMGLMLMYRHKQPKCLPNDFNEFSQYYRTHIHSFFQLDFASMRLSHTLHLNPLNIRIVCLLFRYHQHLQPCNLHTFYCRECENREREREKKRKIYNKSLCCFVCRFIQTGECIDILYQAMRKFILVNSQ